MPGVGPYLTGSLSEQGSCESCYHCRAETAIRGADWASTTAIFHAAEGISLKRLYCKSDTEAGKRLHNFCVLAADMTYVLALPIGMFQPSVTRFALQGVAAKMIQIAAEDAIKQGDLDSFEMLQKCASGGAQYCKPGMLPAGVERLYVHVAQDNHAAMHLYCNRCGFHREQSESEGYARALSRPRRYLLCQQLV